MEKKKENEKGMGSERWKDDMRNRDEKEERK